MPTNLDISDKLLRRAQRISKLKTKKETVTAALEEFIQRHEQKRILKHLGTFDFRDDWDPIRERHAHDRTR